MKTITDQLGYLEEIKRALPEAQIKFVDNFDDVHFGYEISPVPGDLIVFKIDMYEQMKIKINRYSILASQEPVGYSAQMYHGAIPANDEMEPDFDFIRQLVKNYRLIG